MILGESLLSTTALCDATGFAFRDWISVGTPIGLSRTMPLLDKIPYGLKGLYIVGIRDPDGNIRPVYGGKCAAKGEGIRRRIRHEFEFKQNEGSLRSDGCKKLNGPSHVHCALTERGFEFLSYFVTYVVAGSRVRNAGILKMEKEMLGRVDFLANSADNICRRLEVLDGLFPCVEDEYENDDAPVLRSKLKEKDRIIKDLREALAKEKAKTKRARLH